MTTNKEANTAMQLCLNNYYNKLKPELADAFCVGWPKYKKEKQEEKTGIQIRGGLVNGDWETMDKKSADVVVTVALYKVNDKGFRGWLALNFKGDLQKNFFTEVGLTGTVPKPTTKNESGESFLAYVLRMKLEEQEIDGEAKLKEIHRKLQEPQQAAPAVNNNNVLLQQLLQQGREREERLERMMQQQMQRQGAGGDRSRSPRREQNEGGASGSGAALQEEPGAGEEGLPAAAGAMGEDEAKDGQAASAGLLGNLNIAPN